MKHRAWVVALCCAVGGTSSALAQVNTALTYQASTDGVNWASSVNALPGTQVQVRALMSYVGTGTVLGLRQVVFQPVISSWTASDALVTTPGTPGNLGVGPVGGDYTATIGTVPDSPGVYGRINGYGAIPTGTTTFLRGHLGSGTAAGLIRIAQAHVTNWIGVGASTGPTSGNNYNGSGGVNVGQWHPLEAPSGGPPFITSITDLVVFKFGFVLGASSAARTLSVNTPSAGIGHRVVSGGVLAPGASWWSDPLHFTNSDINFGEAVVTPASIVVVPAPGCVTLLVLGLAARRRR